MPEKKTAKHDEQTVKVRQGECGRTAVTVHSASSSSPIRAVPPDTHEVKLAAERKQPDQIMPVQEAFGLTLEQYEEVFRRLA